MAADVTGGRILTVAVNLPPQVDIVDQGLLDAFPEVRFLKARSYDELARVLPTCRVLITNNTGYTPEVGRLAVQRAPHLEWIQFTTTGIDTALRSGLPAGAVITNMRGVRAEVLATHAMALLLGVMRGLHAFEPLRARRQWQRDAMTPFTHALEGGLLVVVGLGSIGRSIARGGLIDEPALIAALQQGRLGGAGLDVVEHEPLAPDSPL